MIWISVGAGTIKRGPHFILEYWDTPLHAGSTAQGHSGSCTPAVVELLRDLQSPLHGDDWNAYTSVPDQRVSVYHDNGGGDRGDLVMFVAATELRLTS